MPIVKCHLIVIHWNRATYYKCTQNPSKFKCSYSSSLLIRIFLELLLAAHSENSSARLEKRVFSVFFFSFNQMGSSIHSSFLYDALVIFYSILRSIKMLIFNQLTIFPKSKCVQSPKESNRYLVSTSPTYKTKTNLISKQNAVNINFTQWANDGISFLTKQKNSKQENFRWF